MWTVSAVMARHKLHHAPPSLRCPHCKGQARHLFYLYIQTYLKDTHSIDCERGDHRILTGPLLKKIQKQILDADMIIADITGRNPNVFYELGMAHVYDKKVILITQDPVADIPADIRHLEFIKYDLSQHVEFLSKLDNAIHHIFVDRYAGLYEKAESILADFNAKYGLHCIPARPEKFHSLVVSAERTQGIPIDSEIDLKNFLLPKILCEYSDINILRPMTEWLNNLSKRHAA